MSNKTKNLEVADVIKVYLNYTKLFSKNEVAAKETYGNTAAAATGYVNRIYYDYEYYDDNTCITHVAVDIDITTMDGYKKSEMKDYDTAQCFFEYPVDVPNIIDLKKGDIATIVGTFNGVDRYAVFNRRIPLSNCVLMEKHNRTNYSQGEIQW